MISLPDRINGLIQAGKEAIRTGRQAGLFVYVFI
jgi:hypothetical protein